MIELACQKACTMYKYWISIFLWISILLLFSCRNDFDSSKNTALSKEGIDNDSLFSTARSRNLMDDYPASNENGTVNVLIEIPGGTLEKWELDKSDGSLKIEFIDSIPRKVNYLGYPCNYGMIPSTLLPKDLGGDGDPLDVMVLGDPIARGTIIECKIIGVLHLLDRGEKDDKLIAVKEGTPFYSLNNIEALDTNYNGILEILKLWFTNYKGPDKMEFKGYGDYETALKILNAAAEAYPSH